jgi:hypothetical protein
MPKQKTAAELRAENRLLRRGHIAQSIASIIGDVSRYGAICFVAWCVYASIDALAGQQTNADVFISFLADVKVSEALAYIFGASGLVLAYRERRLRQRTVEHVQGRNQTREKAIDPGRTSSQLTPKGETNPRDL